MALLCLNSLSPLASPCPSTSLSSCFPLTISVAYRLHIKCIDLTSKSLGGVQLRKLVCVNKTDSIIVRAASDVDGTSPADDLEPPPESKQEVVPVDKLPLESKLQQLQEQRLRMKLAKKIRLRRKRLVRKRRLRKKGRWPPSKVKKMKNV